MPTDIQIMDYAIRDKTPITYRGHNYIAKELIIWYDQENMRQCSLVLVDSQRNTIRVRMRECEVSGNGR